MKEIKKQVEFILHSYPTMKKDIQLLEFELDRINVSLHPEIIESMVLGHSDQERVSGSRISDKTANIAVEHVDSQRNSRYHAIATLLHNTRFELNRLEYYLSMLPEGEAAVIKMFYFDGLAWADIMKEASRSYATMKRRKKDGLDKLIHYYSIIDSIDSNKLDIRTTAKFIGYIHEERFVGCLKLSEKNRSPGIDALLYIISGCNELWKTGVETFFDFDAGTTISYAESKSTLSENGQKLLRLAYHLANGFDPEDIAHVLRYYYIGLEYVHLELAIEAIKLALFPGAV